MQWKQHRKRWSDLSSMSWETYQRGQCFKERLGMDTREVKTDGGRCDENEWCVLSSDDAKDESKGLDSLHYGPVTPYTMHSYDAGCSSPFICSQLSGPHPLPMLPLWFPKVRAQGSLQRLWLDPSMLNKCAVLVGSLHSISFKLGCINLLYTWYDYIKRIFSWRSQPQSWIKLL